MLLRRAKFARFHPLTTPAWRFERLLQLADVHRGRPTRLDDDYVRAAFPFFRLWTSGAKTADELFAWDPDLYVAFHLYESRPVDRTPSMLIENRLLTGESIAGIAEKSRMTAGAVAWYSRLFFDVRSRLGAKDWILAQAIMPEIDRAYDAERQPHSTNTIICQARLDPSLRLYAYLGGPQLYDVLLFNAPMGMRPTSYSAVPDAMDVCTTTAIRAKALLDMGAAPISLLNVVNFGRLSVRLMELQRRYDDKNRERFLAEAVDAIVSSARWNDSTRRSIATEDEEAELNDMHQRSEEPVN